MDGELQLRFIWEWESAPGIRVNEHRATWARLEIRSGDESLTLVEEISNRSSRRSIYVSMYPLAEWIAYHWWTLLYNSRLSRPDAAGFDAVRRSDPFLRHNLRSIGDGFAWPDVLIIPAGTQVHVSWRPYFSPVAGWKARYLSRGDISVSATDIRLELARVVESVIGRLEECGIYETPLQKEWDAIHRADDEEADYCKAAARLGLDPYSEAQEFEEDILRAFEVLPGSLFGDFVDAVSPGRIEESLSWLSNAEAQAALAVTDCKAADHARLQEIRVALAEAASAHGAPPWELGWQQAKAARKTANLAPDRKFNPYDYLGVKSLPSPEVRVQVLGESTPQGAGVVLGDAGAGPRTKKFLLSRAFWHAVTQDVFKFLVTGAYTDQQKVERAFAAEILAPAQGIADVLGVEPWTAAPEDFERVADHFGVSPLLVKHQIDNQLITASP